MADPLSPPPPPTPLHSPPRPQTLQKRLIAKTEEVVEKDLLIQVRGRAHLHLIYA